MIYVLRLPSPSHRLSKQATEDGRTWNKVQEKILEAEFRTLSVSNLETWHVLAAADTSPPKRGGLVMKLATTAVIGKSLIGCTVQVENYIHRVLIA